MLIDTNILLRTLQPSHILYEASERTLELLYRQGKKLHIVPQNLVEMWVVATRPMAQNGLGFTVDEAASELDRVKGSLNCCRIPRKYIHGGKPSSESTEYQANRRMMRGWWRRCRCMV